jgi:adenylate kinase family enzyme
MPSSSSNGRRIFVTGNAGAGKTTLARRLAAESGLPLFHLDQVVWKPGWQKASPAEVADALDRILQNEGWVVEGVSTRVFEAAETVIFLDASRGVCFRRALRRTLRHLFRQRLEMPAGCPEVRVVPKLLRIIWRFPAATRPQIVDLIERHRATKTIHWWTVSSADA